MPEVPAPDKLVRLHETGGAVMRWEPLRLMLAVCLALLALGILLVGVITVPRDHQTARWFVSWIVPISIAALLMAWDYVDYRRNGRGSYFPSRKS